MKERTYPYTARQLRRRRRIGNAAMAFCYFAPLVIILPIFLLGLQNMDCRSGAEITSPRACTATYAVITWLGISRR